MFPSFSAKVPHGNFVGLVEFYQKVNGVSPFDPYPSISDPLESDFSEISKKINFFDQKFFRPQNPIWQIEIKSYLSNPILTKIFEIDFSTRPDPCFFEKVKNPTFSANFSNVPVIFRQSAFRQPCRARRVLSRVERSQSIRPIPFDLWPPRKWLFRNFKKN